MKIKAFITHKLAERYSDCQDFFEINPQRHTIAVADGMSQSIFPHWWAEELVRAYTNGEDIEREISSLQKKWRLRVDKRISEKEQDRPNSAWRIIDNLNSHRGAGSTLCGIKFDGLKWSSFILGDTSVIIVNSDFHIKEIINSNQGGFTNHPDYFDSIKNKIGTVVEKEGVLEKNSYILIVSDPLGELFELKHRIGKEREFVEKLILVKSHKEFIDTIENWRNIELLHNDDTTCVVIQENGDSQFELELIDDLKNFIETENNDEIENQIFEPNIEINKSCSFEIDKELEISVQRYELSELTNFCKSIIQLFQKHKKIKRNDFERTLNKYPSLKIIINKYLS